MVTDNKAVNVRPQSSPMTRPRGVDVLFVNPVLQELGRDLITNIAVHESALALNRRADRPPSCPVLGGFLPRQPVIVEAVVDPGTDMSSRLSVVLGWRLL